MTIYSAAILLFLVMDPLGNVPVFLTVLKDVDPVKRDRIVIRELLISLAVLMLFLFFGQHVLKAMQISEPALSIGGGIILFLIAVKMIFPAKNGSDYSTEREPFIVPLAIPLIAGPSALATVLLMVTRDPERIGLLAIALACAWAATVVILLLGTHFSRFFGKRGLIAMERLMGMILTTISVEMFLGGVKLFMGE
ncbi:MAG: YhgN family NAAT transporter [bacterium]